jgi:hypothetical protein
MGHRVPVTGFASSKLRIGRRFINGLLGGPPAVSLQLDDSSEELYADDRSGIPIEDLTPD